MATHPGFSVTLSRSQYGEYLSFLHVIVVRMSVQSVDSHLLGTELHGPFPAGLLRLHLCSPLTPLLLSQKALL